MLANGFDKEKSDAATQSGLDHAAGNEKRSEDEPNDRISVTGEGFVDSHYPEERQCRNSQQNHCRAWNRTNNRTHDRGRKNREQTPRLRSDARRSRYQQNAGCDKQHDYPADESAAKSKAIGGFVGYG